MRHWYIEWKTSWNILLRHKMILVLLVMQCFFSVWFLGNVYQYIQKGREGTQDLQENVLEKTYYRMHETLDDMTFSMYMDEDSSMYESLYEILKQVRQTDDMEYMFLFSQPVSIYDMEVDEKMLDGYEDRMGQDAVYESDGRRESLVKSLQVSENVFQEFGMELVQGEIWEEDAVSYAKGEIPVILGNEYKGKVAVGDELSGVYLFEELRFKVVGILSENAAVSDGEELINCSRYLLMPSVQETSGENSPTEEDKARLLQQLTGVIVTDLPFDLLEAKIRELAEQQGMAYAKDIVLTSSKENESLLDTYSAMTDELIWQFSVLLGLMILFVIISLSATVNGFVHEYYYDFGVFLLNGAGMKNVAAVIFFLVADVIILGDMLAAAVLAVQNADGRFFFVAAVISMMILISACIYPIRRLHKLDIYEVIGGKE